ncbi:MAG: metal ABC transporter substrate-binding protein [Candidatus Krumholzibacteria bacterium]|nr:metal ABC transporter substrate-binding protein [Candidatus Krumholzibacteria bacterium]
MLVRFIALGLIGLLACVSVPSQAQTKKLKVVTTLAVLKNITEEIGGDRVTVDNLSDPRQDPHYVQPRPTLMNKARKADAFIEIGLQLELWAQKVINGSGNPRIQLGQPGRIIASDGIATLELPRVVSREWGDVHPYGNPHVWLDPINAKRVATNIARGLGRIDRAQRSEYERRLSEFEQRIDEALFGAELVKEIGGSKLTRLAERGRLLEYIDNQGLSGKLGGWLKKAEPLRGQQIVTYHKTWIYFATRFGFSVPIEIEEKPGIPPSAKHRDQVITFVAKSDVRALITADYYDASATDFIATKTGAAVIAVPIDSGGVAGTQSYFDLIDYLIAKISAPYRVSAHG